MGRPTCRLLALCLLFVFAAPLAARPVHQLEPARHAGEGNDPEGRAAPDAEPAAAPEPLPGVTISGQRSNQGWSLAFHLAEPDWPHRILYRFDDDPTWHDTGSYPVVDPKTGRRPPNSWFSVPDAWVTPGSHRVTVKLVGAGDAERGPFELPFDFEAEVLTWAKYEVGRFGGDWVTFWDQDDRKGSALLFTSLMSYKDSLREIRYSLDDCEVGQLFPLRKWTDLARAPGITGDEDPLIRIPFEVQYACVQLVWRDGEAGPVHRFEHETAQRAAAVQP